MSSPDVEVKCFSQRVANGIYDHVADTITSLGKDGLGKADFGIDWTMTIQDNYSGTSWSYVNTKDGRPFRTNIIGQITTSTCGTKHSAKGTHFTKKNIPLSNSDTVKWKWAISKLTLCSPNLTDIWENQLTSIEDWVSEESKRAATGSKINACITKSASDLQYVDLIMLTSQRIYEKPEGVNTNQDATPRQTKLKEHRRQYGRAAEHSSIDELDSNLEHQRALYDLRILPDYQWPADRHAYQTVSVKSVTNRPFQTFQLGIQAIKVLHLSDEPVEERMIPILSMTSIDMSKDDSAIAGFSTFDVSISSAKKNKHTNGQKNKGGKGKEKEKMD
ncbi:hypothetical protein DFJ58DRAFT_843094 [Suillus subalutaceus]|uniref:uncharacterized protein n=1 Tax=Suillus subalutaceus TaxID=48586 RepID=UPI001B870D47|nr:uncharacterized protein DFJ58DRAFT_843094 [Suillus subalutaceus]KAG1847641.1 hypothetical protein DFJ58DRAFT_843094 [Suillus subalutaceus]